MTRHLWVMITVGVLTMGVAPVALLAGDAAPAVDKSKASSQVQQGKRSRERDVQSRGLFSKKKKKKSHGGAAARSQPSDRTDSLSGNPADPAMP